MAQSNVNISLPMPIKSGELSLEQLLQQRRSVREYQKQALNLSNIGQLLWAAQGITNAQGFRTAPSAGALYPLEVYLVVGNVAGLDPGIYRYENKKHNLVKTSKVDLRKLLARAAFSQSWIEDAAVVVVFAAVYERTTKKYGKRGRRYVQIEVGHATQNLFLQAESLGLSTVVVGAFDDEDVAMVLQLPPDVQPMILMPVGIR